MNDKIKNLLIFGALLAVVLVGSNFLALVDVKIAGFTLILSMFIYPIIYLLLNFITRKCGFGWSLVAIFLAFVIQLAVYFIANAISAGLIPGEVIIASLTAFVISTFINLLLFDKFDGMNKINFLTLFLIFIVVNIIDNFLFMFILNSSSGFGGQLVVDLTISTLIKIAVSALFVYVNLLLLRSKKA